MPSVVQVNPYQTPNPALEVGQIAANMQKMRTMAAQRQMAQQKMALAQRMAPSTQGLRQAQMEMMRYKLQHPSTLYSGGAQQVFAGEEAAQQGDPQGAQAIQQALGAHQQFQAANAAWRQKEAKFAALRTIPASSRAPVVSALMKMGFYE